MEEEKLNSEKKEENKVNIENIEKEKIGSEDEDSCGKKENSDSDFIFLRIVYMFSCPISKSFT